jgi:hypothetical protein
MRCPSAMTIANAACRTAIDRIVEHGFPKHTGDGLAMEDGTERLVVFR